MTIDPLAPLRALAYAAIAFAVGLALGAVPMYFYAHAKGEAKHLQAVGALKTSVDSCNVAAAAANATVEADRIEGVAREERIEKALADNVAIVAAATKQRTTILTKPLHGNTECERVINAVNDHFRGGKP